MRRGTAEIKWIPDPHLQRDTVERTQRELEDDYRSLSQLAQVRPPAFSSSAPHCPISPYLNECPTLPISLCPTLPISLRPTLPISLRIPVG